MNAIAFSDNFFRYFLFLGTDSPYDCPTGTFRNITRGKSVDDCFSCPGGKYCDKTGLVNYVGHCDPGYYCPRNSSSRTQHECPEGFFCPIGSEYPSPCLPGTASTLHQLTKSIDCPPCPAGYYCDGTNHTGPTGPCSAGYYCPNGSRSATELTCKSAMHCPGGIDAPKFCADGTYTGWEGAAVCSECPEGFYCSSESVKPGMYCLFLKFLESHK